MGITADKVRDKSLKDRLGQLGVSEIYDFTVEMVNNYLFSKYLKRRKLALKDLNTYWQNNFQGLEKIAIHSLEEEGYTYAYLSVNGQDRYSFVAAYGTDDPVFEVVPDEFEKERWKEIE